MIKFSKFIHIVCCVSCDGETCFVWTMYIYGVCIEQRNWRWEVRAVFTDSCELFGFNRMNFSDCLMILGPRCSSSFTLPTQP